MEVIIYDKNPATTLKLWRVFVMSRILAADGQEYFLGRLFVVMRIGSRRDSGIGAGEEEAVRTKPARKVLLLGQESLEAGLTPVLVLVVENTLADMCTAAPEFLD